MLSLIRLSSLIAVIYKDTFGSAIAGIVKADYRCDGHENIIVCGVDGEVKGYLPSPNGEGSAGTMGDETKDGAGVVGGKFAVKDGRDTKMIMKLNEKKKALMMELANLEVLAVDLERGNGGSGNTSNNIPNGTDVHHELYINYKKKCCELSLNLTSDAVIVSVVVIDNEGGIFDSDTIIHTLQVRARGLPRVCNIKTKLLVARFSCHRSQLVMQRLPSAP